MRLHTMKQIKDVLNTPKVRVYVRVRVVENHYTTLRVSKAEFLKSIKGWGDDRLEFSRIRFIQNDYLLIG